ncbi:MAG: GTPase [Rhizomicrobium sp.]
MIALVGYTNAGKSTLFNKLTSADVLAKDLLFATLDPTMRGLKLPNGTRAVLSDTVGIHRRFADRTDRRVPRHAGGSAGGRHDRPCPRCQPRRKRRPEGRCAEVLADLGVEVDGERPFIEVLNKIDRIEPEVRAGLLVGNGRAGGPVAVSALTGDGLDQLRGRFESELTHAISNIAWTLPHADGEGLAWPIATPKCASAATPRRAWNFCSQSLHRKDRALRGPFRQEFVDRVGR